MTYNFNFNNIIMDSYEQKYKEALERAKAMIKVAANQDEAIGFANTIFPELKESEDEKIRKALINVFATHKDYEMFFGVSVADILAWLEKQGKKNSVTTEEEEKVREQVVYAINKLNVPESEKNKLLDWLEKQCKYTIACSEEQMKVLDEVLNFAANHESPYWNNYIFETLNNFIRQLKN